jgi:hypothetical protein
MQTAQTVIVVLENGETREALRRQRCCQAFPEPGENTMRFLRCFVPAFLLLAGLAVAQDVRYNYDKTADFSKYKTYKWVEIKGSDKDDLLDQQFKATIDSELALKGLTKTDSDNANLYIGYQFAISTEKQVNTFSSGYGYGGGWGAYRGFGASTGTATTSTLYIGSLQLDFYDVATKTTVFRAIGSKQIDVKAKPDKQQKNLSKSVKKILKAYPPTAK